MQNQFLKWQHASSAHSASCGSLLCMARDQAFHFIQAFVKRFWRAVFSTTYCHGCLHLPLTQHPYIGSELGEDLLRCRPCFRWLRETEGSNSCVVPHCATVEVWSHRIISVVIIQYLVHRIDGCTQCVQPTFCGFFCVQFMLLDFICWMLFPTLLLLTQLLVYLKLSLAHSLSRYFKLLFHSCLPSCLCIFLWGVTIHV